MKSPALPPDSLGFAMQCAATVVATVGSGRTLDAALAACWDRHAPAPATRAAIQDLSYGTLRAGGRNDFFLERLLHAPLQDAQALALLRVALFRLEQRPEDAHTTVDQAVAAMAHHAHGKFKSLCNAVLRSFLRKKQALETALAEDDAARWQHPHWWIAELRGAYPHDWQAILTAANARPPMTLRVNRRLGDAAAYVTRLLAAGIHARALDDTAVLLDRPQAVDKLPGFDAGDVSVQDWGAQQAARLLDIRPGQRVLDACAAPGGKTAHMLELADVSLTALELDPQRTERIHANLKRLRLGAAAVVTADCADIASWWDGQPFDRILADVPCTASGVVRRHPDIKWLRRPEDVAGFAATQAKILDSLWRALAPDGTMLYCTCSLFPRENGLQMADFLARHDDARRLEIRRQPDLQLLPSTDQDCFYYALLHKTA